LSGWVETRVGRITVVGATCAVFILCWEGLIAATGLNAIILPRPFDVAWAFWDGLFVRGVFWPHIAVTFGEIVGGFFIGGILGLVLGLAIGQVRFLQIALLPYLIAIESTPKIAVAPLFVIWFGFGFQSKIALAALMCFFPLVINVISGMRATDPHRIEMLTAFSGNQRQIFWWVTVPSALPFIFAGMRIAIVLSVIGAIVAEFVGARSGLGYLVLLYNFDFNLSGMFAILIVLSILGILLNYLVEYIESIVVFWEGRRRNTNTRSISIRKQEV